VTGSIPSPAPRQDLDGAAAGATGNPAPGAGRWGHGPVVALVLLAAAATAVLMLVLLPASRTDPYTVNTLALSGSEGNGGRLFRLNCAGCHGLAAQGLVGPDLHGVVRRKNDRQLIQQVISGATPPMPRFQPEPQAMADLLAFLHSLP
jgi:mono/diheme cytochrome c family protein